MEQRIESAIAFLRNWLNTNVLTWSTAAQWGCVLVVYLLGVLLWRSMEIRLTRWVKLNIKSNLYRSVLCALVDVGNIAGFILLMLISSTVFRSLGHEPLVIEAARELALAWIAIRLLTSMMPNRALARAVSTAIWIVAALSIFGLLTPITDFLHGLSFSAGETSFTALGVIKGLALAAIFLQAATLLAAFGKDRIDAIDDLSPSLKVLLTKAVRILLFTTAVLMAMSAVGIDLTSLAIFSSALGVGIGFGLKTVFSNYVAGVLLLMDDSIKPGDTIEVGEVFGVVRGMHGRYASVLTRDGTEFLIPNEQLISGEVVNWTYSDKKVRIKIPVGISYESDVEKAMRLMEEAGRRVQRVLDSPAPAGRLVEFGDNSVNLQLRIWIGDAEQGVVNVRSEVMLNIWKLFHEQGIEFPFPQRDVLLKPDSALTVTINKDGDNG